jgi:RNA polymerase sigma-70 factor (ECF subfamily)
MSQDPAFAALLDRLRQGDSEAALELFQRYARRLIALARSRLDARVRQKVDPEDVLQSVLKSFIVRHRGGEFDLANWDSLWALLAVLTLRKCGYQTRHFRAARRDVQREQASPVGGAETHASWQVLAREPTPDEAALLAEAVEQLFRGLDESGRQVVELSLQGYKGAEISARLGLAERTVYRLLERVKRKLERLGADDGCTG